MEEMYYSGSGCFFELLDTTKVKKNRNYNLRDKRVKLEKKETEWIIYMW